MKKKNLNHKELKLNKNTISNLKIGELKGGTIASIFQDPNGGCYASVTGCPNETLEVTCDCPPPPTNFSDCGGNCGCETNGLWSC